MLKFRPLRADEVEVRVGTVSEGKGISLLLYKDARCDMAILDETVGAMNWQRRHTRDNANCVVEIWDAEKGTWVGKEDTGTESNTEAQKGQASDSFKRACFNWGIGRELYTSGFLWVSINGLTKEQARKLKFDVAEFEVTNGKISRIVVTDNKGVVVYKKGRTAVEEVHHNAPRDSRSDDDFRFSRADGKSEPRDYNAERKTQPATTSSSPVDAAIDECVTAGEAREAYKRLVKEGFTSEELQPLAAHGKRLAASGL